MSQKDSLKKRIGARLAEAGCDRWSLIAHLLGGGENSNAAFVLMHIIDEMHEAERDTVVVYHDDWRRMYGFGRTRVKTAAKVLAPIGVVYTNHLAQTWHIDEAVFWPAFEAALALVNPQLPPGGGDGSGTPTLSILNTPADPEHPDPAQTVQGGATATGETNTEGVHAEHQIRFDKDIDEKVKLLFSGLRLKLRGRLEQWLGELLALARQLGLEATQAVVARCLKFNAGSWKYIAKALRKEIDDLTHGRQIALLPVAAVGVPAGRPRPAAAPALARPTGLYSDFFNRFDDAAALRPAAAADAAVQAQTPERMVWDVAYQQLKLQMGGGNFDIWVRDARFLRYENDEFVIGVKNGEAQNMLQHRLYRNVARALSDVWGKSASVRFVVDGSSAPVRSNLPDGMPMFQVQAVGS